MNTGREQSEEKAIRTGCVCRCFAPPPGSEFVKGKLYQWDYCIDGMVVYDESGEAWYTDEVGMASRFQILCGKNRR